MAADNTIDTGVAIGRPGVDDKYVVGCLLLVGGV
jgi:hypothetical protein